MGPKVVFQVTDMPMFQANFLDRFPLSKRLHYARKELSSFSSAFPFELTFAKIRPVKQCLELLENDSVLGLDFSHDFTIKQNRIPTLLRWYGVRPNSNSDANELYGPSSLSYQLCQIESPLPPPTFNINALHISSAWHRQCDELSQWTSAYNQASFVSYRKLQRHIQTIQKRTRY